MVEGALTQVVLVAGIVAVTGLLSLVLRRLFRTRAWIIWLAGGAFVPVALMVAAWVVRDGAPLCGPMNATNFASVTIAVGAAVAASISFLVSAAVAWRWLEEAEERHNEIRCRKTAGAQVLGFFIFPLLLGSPAVLTVFIARWTRPLLSPGCLVLAFLLSAVPLPLITAFAILVVFSQSSGQVPGVEWDWAVAFAIVSGGVIAISTFITSAVVIWGRVRD